jgi:hypothetical protein
MHTRPSKTVRAATALIALSTLTACAPEVGSKPWCEQLEEKPKGEWTLDETGEYAKSCIIRLDDEEK